MNAILTLEGARLKKDFTTNLRNKRNPEKNFEQKHAKIAKQKCFAIFVSGGYAIHQKSQNGALRKSHTNK
jgi:hypothetical protein